jgi:hypothetical protein
MTAANSLRHHALSPTPRAHSKGLRCKQGRTSFAVLTHPILAMLCNSHQLLHTMRMHAALTPTMCTLAHVTRLPSLNTYVRLQSTCWQHKCTHHASCIRNTFTCAALTNNMHTNNNTTYTAGAVHSLAGRHVEMLLILPQAQPLEVAFCCRPLDRAGNVAPGGQTTAACMTAVNSL